MGLAVTKRMLERRGLDDARGRVCRPRAGSKFECMKHPDYNEAYRAFVEKRPTDFVSNWPGHAAAATDGREA